MGKKTLTIFMIGFLAAGLLFCAGCVKQSSSFVPQAVYVYDESQDLNRSAEAEELFLPEVADPKSSAKMVKNSASTEIENDKDSAKEENVANKQETENPQSTDNVKDHEGKRNNPAFEKVRERAEQDRQSDDALIKNSNKSGKLNEDHNGQIIDANADSGDISGSESGTRTEEYPDENGKKAADVSDDKVEQNHDTEEEINQQEKEEQKEQDSARKGDDENKSNADLGKDKTKDDNKGNEKESTAKLDPEKVVTLSYEGDLGTYIWGEAVDLSGMFVTATFEDGHKEQVSDYMINMNYPALQDVGIYTYERIGAPLALDNYTPGTYNATIEYHGVSIEVPYRLIIMYGLLLVDHHAECQDPEDHDADQDEYGHYRCHYCGYPSQTDPNCMWVGEGHLVMFPLLYDYVLTSEDIWDSSFFSSGVDLGSYYFEGFPAVYDKYSGQAALDYGPDRYRGTGGALPDCLDTII